MDLFADPALKDKVSPFVQLLWERGSLYEEEVIEGLSLPFVDLSHYAGDEKEQQTLEAMNRKEPLIYSAHASKLTIFSVTLICFGLRMADTLLAI